MYDKAKIKKFVQDVLGCGCSEDVFETIVASEIKVSGMDCIRLNIGNRLLVYLLNASEVDFVPGDLGEIFRTGKADRDSNNFNRFRLALSTENPGATGKAARAAFITVPRDEKIHLHILKSKDIDIWK